MSEAETAPPSQPFDLNSRIAEWTRLLMLAVMAYDREVAIPVAATRLRASVTQEVVDELVQKGDVEGLAEVLPNLIPHMSVRRHQEGAQRLSGILLTEKGKEWAAELLAEISKQEQEPTFTYAFTNEGRRPPGDPLIRRVEVLARNLEEARAFCLTRHSFDLGKEGGLLVAYPEGCPEKILQRDHEERAQRTITRFRELLEQLGGEGAGVRNLLATKLQDDLVQEGEILGARVEVMPCMTEAGPATTEVICHRPRGIPPVASADQVNAGGWLEIPNGVPLASFEPPAAPESPVLERLGQALGDPEQIKEVLGSLGVPADVMEKPEFKEALAFSSQFGSQVWPYLGPALLASGRGREAGPIPEASRHFMPHEAFTRRPPSTPYEPSYHESFTLGNAPGQVEASSALIQQQEQIHEMRAAQRNRALVRDRKKEAFRDAVTGALYMLLDRLEGRGAPLVSPVPVIPTVVTSRPAAATPADPFGSVFVPFDTEPSGDVPLSRAHVQKPGASQRENPYPSSGTPYPRSGENF